MNNSSVQNYLIKTKNRLDSVLGNLWQSRLQSSLASGLDDVLIGSDFVVSQLETDRELISWLNDSFSKLVDHAQLAHWVEQLFFSHSDESELMVELRRLRNRIQVGFIWHDLSGSMDVWSLTSALSKFADLIIIHLIDWCTRRFAHDFGTPMSYENGEKQSLAVLAMGKLGGQELNLSSDIDLIFVYGCRGSTAGGLRSLSNEQYFSRLGQLIIKILNTHTAEGFVFRVDMRLRPFGQSGPIVSSLVSFEKYYAEQGRDWERYAMLKSRILSSDQALSASIKAIIQPFVYRKYIDFSVIDGLRSMKRMIISEFNDESVQNIKLGRGGIRELEFFVQAFQLVRGGQEPALREKNWRQALLAIKSLELISQDSCDRLEQSYIFLRKLEHRLQAIKDQQTQVLPSNELLLARLAWCMGYQSIERFNEDLNAYRDRVADHFEKVVGSQHSDDSFGDHGEWSLGKSVWDQHSKSSAFQKILGELPVHQDVINCLVQFADMRLLKTIDPLVAQRLSFFMAISLTLIIKNNYPVETIRRFLAFVESVLRRSTYIVALIEHPFALKELLVLINKSVWLSQKIIDQPFLVDELLDNKKLYMPLSREALQRDLQARLLRGTDGDEEFVINSLRYFHDIHLMRIAASELSGSLSMMSVSDHLTWLAETILQSIVSDAWKELSQKYGSPIYDTEEDSTPFIVVGYGKLGGYELSYSSDLDIVFIYENSLSGMTNGDKPIEDSVFYSKLAQKIIHYLSVRTKAGMLYEVDVRLRPSGNSGLLVSSMIAFEKYQLEKAWTWERQALVKARVVWGTGGTAEKFNEVRKAAIISAGIHVNLKREFMQMREKMLLNLGPAGRECANRNDYSQKVLEDNRFHLKHDPGGMIDIEFIVQYRVLAHAGQCLELLRYNDNIRILDELARFNIVEPSVVKALQDAYLKLRSAQHHGTLRCDVDYVEADKWSDIRRIVMDVWDSTFET